MAKLLQDSTRNMVEVMKKMISESFEEAQAKIQQVRKYNRFTLLSSAAILIAFGLLLFAVLLPI